MIFLPWIAIFTLPGLSGNWLSLTKSAGTQIAPVLLLFWIVNVPTSLSVITRQGMLSTSLYKTFRILLSNTLQGVKYSARCLAFEMETKTKGKKITRSYMRGLLEHLKDLGVQNVLWRNQELWLEDGSNQRRGTNFETTVRILAAQDSNA